MSIDVNYFSFSPSRSDKKWENFREDIVRLRKKYQKWSNEGKKDYNRLTTQFTKGEKELFKYESDYFLTENEYDEQYLHTTIKVIDLYYGSVIDKGFESSSNELYFLDSIIKVVKPELEDNLPTKSGWIQIFSLVNIELITKISIELNKKTGWDIEKECKYGIIDYLQTIKPVIKDLKRKKDAIFIRFYHGELDVEPQSSENLLFKRAKLHKSQYKGMLPPVL